MFGREEFQPVIDSITIGLQVLLVFIGLEAVPLRVP
jgi:hypothetical protein